MKATILAQKLALEFCSGPRGIDFIDQKKQVTEAFALFLGSRDNPEDAEASLRLALVSKLKRASLQDIMARAGEILNWEPQKEEPKAQAIIRKKRGKKRKPRF